MWTTATLNGSTINGQDGTIGTCCDFLFDDKDWVIRYVIADTSQWLRRQEALISPISLGKINAPAPALNVCLTREQVELTPPLPPGAQISRSYEHAFNNYYDWAHYWHGGSLWGPHAYPRLLINTAAPEGNRQSFHDDQTTLRLVSTIHELRDHSGSSKIGSVRDFVIDCETWLIRYAIVYLPHLCDEERMVPISPTWISLEGETGVLAVTESLDRIKNSPRFDPALGL